jgi:hypothetical protein
MTKKLEYNVDAVLYRWNYREDDGLVRLIGTDPDLKDKARFFRWIDEPLGWTRREIWAQGASNVTAVDQRVGTGSGWPGALPVTRPLGRPKKELAKDDQPVTVTTSLRRGELFEIMRRAADARLSVSEWVADVVRGQLDRPGTPGKGTDGWAPRVSDAPADGASVDATSEQSDDAT